MTNLPRLVGGYEPTNGEMMFTDVHEHGVDLHFRTLARAKKSDDRFIHEPFSNLLLEPRLKARSSGILGPVTSGNFQEG